MNHSIAVLCFVTAWTPLSAAARHEAQAAATPDRPCVAVSLPTVTAPDDVDASALSATLQEGLVSALAAEGRDAQALAADGLAPAAAASCDARVTTRLVLKRKGGSSWVRRALTDATGAAVSQVPVRGVAGVAATAAVGSGVQTFAGLAAASQKRDEVRLTYGVVVSGRTVVPDVSAGARVATNGQDVLTPLVAGTAKAIVTALAKGPRGAQ